MNTSTLGFRLIIVGLAASLGGAATATAQDSAKDVDAALQEAFRKGYDAGYRAGYADGKGGGTIGKFKGPLVTGGKKGGGTTGREPLVAFELDAGTERWKAGELKSATKSPATLDEVKNVMAKEGATSTTVVIEGLPVAEIPKLRETVRSAKGAQLLIEANAKK